MVLALGLCSCAGREGPLTVVTTPEPRQVNVTGEAEVRVAPDEVVITVGVQTGEDTLAEAKRRNDELIAKVHGAAKAAGVEPKRIQTEYIEIEPRYQDRYEQRTVSGFVVRRVSTLTIRDVPRFEAILSAIVAAGATEVLGVQFRTTELRKYKDQARELAIRAAKEKAEALTKELGEEIGRPRLIEEENMSWFYPFGSWWSSRMGGMAQNVVQNVAGPSSSEGGDEALAPGQISIFARIRVVFELGSG